MNHYAIGCVLHILVSISRHLELVRIQIVTAGRILLNVHQVGVDVLVRVFHVLRPNDLRR